MLDPKFFDNLAKQLAELIPPGLHNLKSELEKNIHQTLSQVFSKLNLVTREEFDVQTRLLESAKKRIAALDAKISELENT
jgi:ubiquinone biosynthesis accessory factor UbiK